MPAPPVDGRLMPHCFEGLLCVFCRGPLSSFDALKCKSNYYNRVRRGDNDYGACVSCTEKALILERTVFPAVPVDGELIEIILGKSLLEVIIRCYHCGSALNENEKNRHLLDQEPFMSVREKYRGRCYDCSSDGSRPCVFDYTSEDQ
ncbi:E6 [Cervus papillomavirus 2]|uniref:Protein E6 n=1 Tax=Cervus elaphus papillomavirus 1 TaxID=1163699 RepID=A0A182BAE7_9PAPI|nr:E6 [Cervus papillomavirus 2]ALX18685.1 E6 [Cervus papillomavirus 2]